MGLFFLGDKTSSGGAFLAASQTRKVNGKGIARVGDPASYPQHCTSRIAEGEATLKDEGKALAFHGYRLTCGCTLISSMLNVGGSRYVRAEYFST